MLLYEKQMLLLRLTVYDNEDILHCKQHISDLFKTRGKNRLNQYASETESSHWLKKYK